jgi:hypothetical protein
MKSCFLLLFVFALAHAKAQHFEWAASASQVALEYQYACTDPRGNITVAGPASQNWSHKGRTEVYDGKGNIVKLPNLNEEELILNYSSSGTVNWSRVIGSRYAKIAGLAYDAEGNTVMLLFIKGLKSEDGKYLGKVYGLVEEYVESGWYVVAVDDKGEPISHKPIFDNTEPDMDFMDFKAYPGGGFVITAHAEPDTEIPGIKVDMGKAGGDLLVLIDSEGKTLWARLAQYQHELCCSYYAGVSNVAIADNGTLYLGGTYSVGAKFDKNIVKMAEPMLNKKGKNEGFESYVASYSPEGKLNWVKTSDSKSLMSALSTNSEGVYVGLRTTGEQDNTFGVEIDTLGGKNAVLMFLNTKGKVQWSTTAGAEEFHYMQTDVNGDVYALGTAQGYGRGRALTREVGTDTLSPRKDVFVAKFSKKGTYQWLKEASIPVQHQNVPLMLKIDQCNNLYIVGGLHFMFNMEMSIWDEAFIKGVGGGSAPLIAKLNNTRPSQEQINEINLDSIDATAGNKIALDNHNSCIISPGPWKLKVYPNPLQERATIDFETTYADQVSISVFDLKGKLVVYVLARKKYESGRHSVPFEGKLAPGPYLVVLKGSGTIATQRIIVQ